MSLDIGELVGRLILDDSDYERGLKEAPEKASHAGSRIGKAMSVAGAAGGTALSVGLVQSISAEPARDKLNAQLGLTGADAARAGKTAAALYRNNFGADIGQVNEAIKAVVQDMNQQINGADFQPLTAQVLSLADTFDQDLGGVTRAAGQLMRTGLARNAQEALDIIARGFQTGADKSEDFLDTLNEYGTQFRKLGISGGEATALISQGLQAGARDGDIVADAIKEFAIRAVDGSKTTSDAFKGIGLNAKQMSADIAAGGPSAERGLGTVLDKLRAVEDPAKRAQIATALFGTQAEDLGSALYALDTTKAQKGLTDVAGAAQKVSDTVGDNTSGKIETYRRKLLGLGQEAVESTGPLAAVAGAAAAFGPAVLSTLAPIAQLVAARTVSTAAATAAAAAEVEVGAASTIALGPIGLIVVAVAALAAGMVYAYKHSETFRDILNSAFRVVLKVIDLLLLEWQTLLGALGHIPGFGWAKTAAREIGHARDKIEEFSDSLKKIPEHKFVSIILRTPSTKELAGVGGTKGLTLVGTDGARAAGGPVRAGLAYLVGEHEPEVYVPGQDGRIYNQQQLAAMRTGATGGSAAPIDYDLLAGAITRAIGPRINVEKIDATPAPGERAADTVTRELHGLAFQLSGVG